MKVLITKSDGTPTKSKVHALQFLEKKGISKDCLISENGQFFYEDEEVKEQTPIVEEETGFVEKTLKQVQGDKVAAVNMFNSVTWDTPVFDKNNEKTKLFIPGSDVTATINAKHPAGQIKSKSSFELCIEGENVILSLDLVSKIFKIRG